MLLDNVHLHLIEARRSEFTLQEVPVSQFLHIWPLPQIIMFLWPNLIRSAFKWWSSFKGVWMIYALTQHCPRWGQILGFGCFSRDILKTNSWLQSIWDYSKKRSLVSKINLYCYCYCSKICSRTKLTYNRFNARQRIYSIRKHPPSPSQLFIM